MENRNNASDSYGYRIKVGQRLKELRKSKKMSQEYFAENVVNRSEKTVSNWETGNILPEMETIYSLAQFYGVSLDYLLCNTDYTNIGNEEISKITGLSNDSIEVLRFLNRVPKESTEWNDVGAFNRLTIDFINNVLESATRSVDKNKNDEHGGFPIETLFSLLQGYIFGSDGTALSARGFNLDTMNDTEAFHHICFDASPIAFNMTVSEAYEAVQFTQLIEAITRMKEQQEEKITNEVYATIPEELCEKLKRMRG